MIPILYDSNETLFTSNGLGRLRDCISCTVTEERNGIYEADFQIPVDGANFDLIQCGRIIGVTFDESGEIQPFDIVSYSKPINGIVTFHAVHISYRQSKMVTYGTGVNSLADAFDMFDTVFFPDNPLGQDAGGNPFTYLTDKYSTGYCAAFDGTPRTIRSILGGVEGSILDTYGGEFEWDKWFVKLHSARGQMKDFTIRYGVNMTNFQDDTDYSESFNTCVPYWADTNAGIIVKGSEISSGQNTIGIGNKCVPLDLSDKFDSQPSVADLEAMALQIMTAQQPFLPQQTIKVDFVRLQDEAGFDDFDNLLQCKLCDSIKVIFPGYNMSAYYKIVKTVWNVLLDRYDEMELGNLSTTLAEALGIDNASVNTEPIAEVIESGSYGIWNYRKWSDGTSECWGTASASLTNYYSGGGFYGYRTGNVAFPTSLFDSAPVVTVDGKIGSGFYLGTLIDSVSSTQFEAIAMSTASGTVDCTFYIHAIGKWR